MTDSIEQQLIQLQDENNTKILETFAQYEKIQKDIDEYYRQFKSNKLLYIRCNIMKEFLIFKIKNLKKEFSEFCNKFDIRRECYNLDITYDDFIKFKQNRLIKYVYITGERVNYFDRRLFDNPNSRLTLKDLNKKMFKRKLHNELQNAISYYTIKKYKDLHYGFRNTFLSHVLQMINRENICCNIDYLSTLYLRYAKEHGYTEYKPQNYKIIIKKYLKEEVEDECNVFRDRYNDFYHIFKTGALNIIREANHRDYVKYESLLLLEQIEHDVEQQITQKLNEVTSCISQLQSQIHDYDILQDILKERFNKIKLLKSNLRKQLKLYLIYCGNNEKINIEYHLLIAG